MILKCIYFRIYDSDIQKSIRTIARNVFDIPPAHRLIGCSGNDVIGCGIPDSVTSTYSTETTHCNIDQKSDCAVDGGMGLVGQGRYFRD